jgi:hypothetical protein
MAFDQQPAGGVPRRRVILNGAGLAAAGLVVGAAAGVAADSLVGGSGDSGGSGASGPAAAPSDPVMVHLRDADSGQLDLFVGTRHIQFTDRGFASRLVEVAETAD